MSELSSPQYFAYSALPDRLDDLKQEIAQHPQISLLHTFGSVCVAQGEYRPLIFSQNDWLDVKMAKFESIQQAAQILKSEGKIWHCEGDQYFRRSTLIQEKLISPKKTIRHWGDSPLNRSLGAWLLQDEKTLWYSSQTTSPYPAGVAEYAETKLAPSRAYLKLWDFFNQREQRPKPGEVCIDLGSCPGGWTWVLAENKNQVLSVDKAPLTLDLNKYPLVKKIKQDAFVMKPQDVGAVDWLFSDIICYPERLLELVHLWNDSGLVKNFVCTIKFQGPTDFVAMNNFLKISGSKIEHLSQNKHEVTWFLLRD